MKFLLWFSLFVFISDAKAFLPMEAYTFEFNIKTIGMDRLKEDKIYEGTELLRKVFSSPEFKEKILEHRFRGRKAFAFNRGLSNKEIYRRILLGIETLQPYKNNAMDVEIELYSDYSSNVLGFTRPGTRRIWMNRKYFNKHSPVEIASHLTHEWLHKLGFDHERERTPDRKYSVPYAVGYIVKELAREYEYDFENVYTEGPFERERGFRHRENQQRGDNRRM